MVDAHDGETYTAKGSRLIWIDCEMTGLDIFHDELCEISVVPTDFDLNVLDEGIDFVIKPSNAAVANMNDFVRAMHTRSGLINEWENGLSVEEAERKVTEYVARFTPDGGKSLNTWPASPRTATPDGVKPLLAGNSIGSDKKFLDRYMPNLMEHLHYRVIDVSTFKELARRWYPAVYNNRPPKNGGHRALADIIESLDELRYYRKAFMAAAPGPDAAEAKAIADQIVATSILNNN
ncbi:MAG: oligoribonuclease [Bifidobacteriales bacterium 56_10]|nr:MAG: oligoribonuclease [Bifidobacteriales bacterium 56_10]